MSGKYLAQLDGELAKVGISGRLRRRIVTEFADHLESDPAADLGSPAALARQFADELGTARARGAAFRAFAGLALAGGLFAVAVASAAALGGVGRSAVSPPVVLLMSACIVAAQVSFVAGGLGLLRAFRLRRERVLPAGEAVVLVRRAGVGLAAGAVTMLALPAMALAAPHALTSAWRTFAFVAASVGLAAIVVAVPSVFAAVRVRPSAEGDAGDLFSDLGPLVPPALRVAPWRFAALVALTLAGLITAAGLAADDPYDGALRGLAEAVACLAGYGLLGAYLGLRAA